MSEEFISVTEALKLISPFSGSKKEILTFISNVDTAFRAVHPNQDRLYQFVLTKISGEPRTSIEHRNLDNWEELKEFLRNMYIEKRTLDFHANQLFKAKQHKVENLSEWIQKIQMLGSKFRASALQDCCENEKAGILSLSDKLRNIRFIQGLYSYRIQMIVHSRNNESFDDIAETALEEESAMISKHERYKGDIASPLKCSNCGKLGHINSKCFAKKDVRINQVTIKGPGQYKEVICFCCNGKGHFARNCKRTDRKFNRQSNYTERPENEARLLESSRPAVNSVQ
jgi:hypothetical protein